MLLDKMRSVGCLVMGVAIGLSLAKIYNLGSGNGGSSNQAAASLEKAHHYDYGGSSMMSKTAITPQRSSNTKTKSPINFIEEYIPTKLLDKYQQKHFTFPVTKSMLRQSRPVIGNLQRLHTFIRKLQSSSSSKQKQQQRNQCTITLILGGSVSKGHNVKGGKLNAYPAKFMEWLNTRYPCMQEDGITPGTHSYKATFAQNSQTHFSAWSTVDALERFDLVIIEFNINDHFLSDLPHALEDKGPTGETEEYISLWYFEVLLRRILLMRKPDPPAIITFNADYIGRTWAPPPHFDPEKARKTLFYYNQEPMKIWLSSLYEIPVFSASLWMLPLASKRGQKLQFGQRAKVNNATANPYATDIFHADRCCHPRKEGHLILSLVLAYCFVEEEKLMASYYEESNTVEVENDFTVLDIPLLRDPVYLSPEEEDLYVRHDVEYAGVDFTDPTGGGEELWKDDVIVANEGWTWYADNKDKDKYGYIANDVTGGQHIAISLSGGQHGRVEISYVISYENFGIAIAWLDESSDLKKKKQELCETKINNKQPGKTKDPERLFSMWGEKASVAKVQILEERLDENKTMVLHVCLTPHNDELVVGEENKFKLLGVRVY